MTKQLKLNLGFCRSWGGIVYRTERIEALGKSLQKFDVQLKVNKVNSAGVVEIFAEDNTTKLFGCDYYDLFEAETMNEAVEAVKKYFKL